MDRILGYLSSEIPRCIPDSRKHTLGIVFDPRLKLEAWPFLPVTPDGAHRAADKPPPRVFEP